MKHILCVSVCLNGPLMGPFLGNRSKGSRIRVDPGVELMIWQQVPRKPVNK
jgi:hypothetical protein